MKQWRLLLQMKSNLFISIWFICNLVPQNVLCVWVKHDSQCYWGFSIRRARLKFKNWMRPKTHSSRRPPVICWRVSKGHKVVEMDRLFGIRLHKLILWVDCYIFILSMLDGRRNQGEGGKDLKLLNVLFHQGLVPKGHTRGQKACVSKRL